MNEHLAVERAANGDSKGRAHDKRPTILIVDDTPANISILLEYLHAQGFRVLVARDGKRAIEQTSHVIPDLILLDVVMPGIDGFETCRRFKRNPAVRDVPVIFMTALSDTNDKVRGFDAGAVDYVTKPFQHEEVLARVNTHILCRKLQQELKQTNERLEQRVADRTSELQVALERVEELKDQLEAENVYLKEEIKLNANFDEIVGRSAAMTGVLAKVEQVAATDATVLILGETGTGKELFARAIHDHSARAARPLVKVNCAALPHNLIESELFGHEKGAFTGATARRPGRFELADGGTIFLDEIGDLPLELQAKLLRVLQEGEFERIGGTSTIHVDVRVIAATNRRLEERVAENQFREDLFYRLNVFPLTLPPLRARKGDVAPLVQFFVNKYERKMGRRIDSVPQSVMKELEAYSWPGNVRELENVIERSLVLSRGTSLRLDDTLNRPVRPSARRAEKLEDVERDHIASILEQSGWQVEGSSGAASRLGMNPSTLRSRMKKLGISRAE